MPTRVLLVHYDESNLDLTRGFLENSAGMKVRTVASLDLALEALDSGEFDVIVSDYAMSGKDSIELLRILRSRGSEIPFIMFVKEGEEGVAVEALNEGADFYLRTTEEVESHFAELAAMIGLGHQRTLSRRVKEEKYDRFERLANTTPDLIWRIRIKPDIAVEYMNPALESWVGYSPEDFYRDASLLFSCIHEEDGKVLEQAVKNPSKFSQPMVTRWIHRNGTMRWAEDRWGVLQDQNGDITVIEGISRDVTERVRSEDALRQANKKLELITSLVRHDILNKLTSIVGFVELARAGDGKSLTGYLEKIHAATKLIARQLQFSSDYQKTISDVPIWVDLRDIVKDSTSPPSLGNVEVALEVGDFEVLSDYSLSGVFSNLVDDSLTHGASVSRIRIRTELKSDGLDVIYEDDGIGIPIEEKELIFQKGYGKGTGYGLYLSREILRVSGITMTESGEPGKGARFVIHFPMGTYKSTSRCEVRPDSAGTDESS